MLIHHFDYPNKKSVSTNNFLQKRHTSPSADSALKIVITSGASCPDSLLDAVMNKLNTLIGNTKNSDEVIKTITTYSEKSKN